jgi:hypothetical protein
MPPPQARDHKDREMSEDRPSGKAEMATIGNDDFTQLDDSALLSWRAEMRANLERLPVASAAHNALTALYDESTQEVDARARRAWSRTGKATQ